MSKHKIAIIFLWIINIINLIAGIVTQVKLITQGDVTSVIPITVDMTVDQILIVNFMAFAIIMTLISVITMYITVDVSYSPFEVLSNCAGIFVIPSVILLGLAVFNTIRADVMADKIAIIISAVVYILLTVIDVSCVLTVMEDNEL